MDVKLPFFQKKRKEPQTTELDKNNIPKHIAIIMDGNGRWANNKGLPRVAGHHEGMKVVRKIVSHASGLGVEILTLYAFSTENWKRPKSEVDFLMRLPEEFLDTYLPDLYENNIKVICIGDPSSLPPHTQKALESAIEKTKNNTGMKLNFALNYGSRHEIVCAVNQIIKDKEGGVISDQEITEDLFSSYLFTKSIQDPDLLIRTSGEIRLSNFLLWQVAYTEFWFTDVLWPDFCENELNKALLDYQKRKRRYGGI